jgi:uncharacterized protein YuzE
MEVHYDKEQDILYLAFKDGPSHEVLESTPNIVLELDENKEIMGLEIWNARKIGLLEQVGRILFHQTPSRTSRVNGSGLHP